MKITFKKIDNHAYDKLKVRINDRILLCSTVYPWLFCQLAREVRFNIRLLCLDECL